MERDTGTAPAQARVTKRGPLAGGIRFESIEGLQSDRSEKSVVDMDFPRSKSRMEVRWTVEDPERWVSGMMADLNLLIEDPPTLVDFGANNTFYAVLKPGQRIELSAAPPDTASPSWFVHLDGQPYASRLRSRAEAWGPCNGQGAGFGAESRDRIEVSADGRLLIRRDFARGGEGSLHFWLHFVTMPVHLGAATSPQAMQSRYKWSGNAGGSYSLTLTRRRHRASRYPRRVYWTAGPHPQNA